MALQPPKNAGPAGADRSAEDPEDVQVPLDQGALSGHLILPMRIGGGEMLGASGKQVVR